MTLVVTALAVVSALDAHPPHILVIFHTHTTVVLNGAGGFFLSTGGVKNLSYKACLTAWAGSPKSFLLTACPSINLTIVPKSKSRPR